MKDRTSFYLEFFPQWDFVDLGLVSEGLSATQVRDAFFEEGKAGQARIGHGAAASLVEARELAATAVAAAMLVLDDAVTRFDGTPYADDLSAALDALRERSLFPVLVGPTGAEELR